MSHMLFEEKNVKWTYNERELKTFRELWKDGVSFVEICKALKLTKLNGTLLIIDQAEAGEIKPRKNGVFGEEG